MSGRMTDTPDPWKDAIAFIKLFDSPALYEVVMKARASSDAQTRQRVEDAFQAGFNRGRQEKCDGRH